MGNVETLLALLYADKNGGGGGGGGTTNYNALTNRPKINGHVLEGDKTPEELGIKGQAPDITVNASVDDTTGTPSVEVTKSGTDEAPIFEMAFTGLKGQTGQQGAPGAPGAPGPTGEDGFSPEITVEEITGGHRITITTKTGTESFDVMDGQGGGSDADVFVATYGVTTAQQINAFLDSNDPKAPMVVKRGNDYYTVITTAKQAENKVIIRTFASLSGAFYIFTYTVTDNTWSNSNYGVQKILVSGTDIKTINGQSLLGSGNIEVGGSGASDWDSIANKPTDLAEAVELTQEEYDALSDEEKKNGKIYFITDGEGGGGAVDPIIFDLTQPFVYTEVDAAIDSKKPIGFVDAVGNTIWATGIQSDTEGRYFTGYFRGNSYSIIAREVETAWDVSYSAIAMKEYVDRKLTDGAWETNQGGYVTINPRLKNGWACIALNGGYLKKDIPVGSTTITTLGDKYKPTTSITVPLMVLPERTMSGTVSVDINGNVIVNTPTAIEVGGGTRSLCASLVYPV